MTVAAAMAAVAATTVTATIQHRQQWKKLVKMGSKGSEMESNEAYYSLINYYT